jgi:hypothetical protein
MRRPRQRTLGNWRSADLETERAVCRVGFDSFLQGSVDHAARLTISCPHVGHAYRVIFRSPSCRRTPARGMGFPLSGHFEVGHVGCSATATSCYARLPCQIGVHARSEAFISPTFFVHRLASHATGQKMAVSQLTATCSSAAVAPDPMRRSSSCGRDRRRTPDRFRGWQT